MKITSVFAREVLDSRGNPTVEVEIKTDNGGFGRAITPSGASTGKYEAFELRDGNDKKFLSVFGAKGVQKAVYNVNNYIVKKIVGMDVEDQKNVDNAMIELDGTENKSKLGANGIVATSMAVLKAAANSNKLEVFDYLGGKKIPGPMLNIVNGGKHAGGKLAIQEFMIIPETKKFKSFRGMLSASVEIYHLLGKILVKKYGLGAKNIGDEGGYAPPIQNTDEALDVIEQAIEEAGYKGSVGLGMDIAASSFYENGKYLIDGEKLDKEELMSYYFQLLKEHKIASIEDPFEEEDFDSFAQFTKNTKIQVVGDDLLVTNPKKIKRGIEEKSCNSLLLKVNQIGTVTEATEASKMCKKAGWNVIVSHRSGETEDAFIADFAVGINAGQIKTGAPARGERTAKYNQLLRIAEKLEA